MIGKIVNKFPITNFRGKKSGCCFHQPSLGKLVNRFNHPNFGTIDNLIGIFDYLSSKRFFLNIFDNLNRAISRWHCTYSIKFSKKVKHEYLPLNFVVSSRIFLINFRETHMMFGFYWFLMSDFAKNRRLISLLIFEKKKKKKKKKS